MKAAEIVGLLAEPERLRVLSALVLGARTPGAVVAATGLGAREVGRALQKLQTGGLVDGSLAVRVEAIKDAAIAAAPPGGADQDGVDEVVGRFVRGNRLVAMPAHDGKRRQVLEHVVQSFEPGRRFPEREVDTVLRAWTDGGGVDHVAVRRYLVDHGLLAREGGLYWRIGGWVDVSAGAGS